MASTPLKTPSSSSIGGGAGTGNDARSPNGQSEAVASGARAASKSSVASSTGSGLGSSSNVGSPYRTSEFYIIRVQIEENGPETEGESCVSHQVLAGLHSSMADVILTFPSD